MSKSKKILIVAVVAVGFILTLAELGARLAGVTDFPVYLADDQIGYILAPTQHGKFLDRNTWVFNEKSQGTTHWQPNGTRDLLLLGDSLVLGGNPLDQSQKLGPLLEKKLKDWRVWPASAGSWSVANEIAYLDRFPDVEKESDAIVWVVNTGDLAAASKWKLEETHPRSHPASSLLYALQKYVILPHWKRSSPTDPPASLAQFEPGTETALSKRYAELVAREPNRRILFVIYPGQPELKPADPQVEALYQKFCDRFRKNVGEGAEILELRNDPRWNASLYRDAIHPSGAGDAVFAEIVAGRLRGADGQPVAPRVTSAP